MVMRLSLIAAFAIGAAGCEQAPDVGSKQSVTVKLPPPRPYKPEPGFSLATDLPVRAGSGGTPRS